MTINYLKLIFVLNDQLELLNHLDYNANINGFPEIHSYTNGTLNSVFNEPRNLNNLITFF